MSLVLAPSPRREPTQADAGKHEVGLRSIQRVPEHVIADRVCGPCKHAVRHGSPSRVRFGFFLEHVIDLPGREQCLGPPEKLLFIPAQTGHRVRRALLPRDKLQRRRVSRWIAVDRLH